MNNWTEDIWGDLDRIDHNAKLLNQTQGDEAQNSPMLLFADGVQTIVAVLKELRKAVNLNM